MTRDPWRLPGYRVEELLGAGATGQVWRARVHSTGVPVALKRIPVASPELRDAALSEAAMLSALDHPHLMKLHELRRLDDAVVLVLDLASGGTLASLLDRRGRLTVGETITALAPIAAAVAYAHNAGVVHGDVSSANILFTDIGLPLLADLGVARLLGEVAPVRTTPTYADPLLCEQSVPGPASDVFMLGGVALHALTGTPPWTDPSGADRRLAAVSGEQPDFGARLRSAGIAEPVIEVVARALTVEPAQRGTAADFALDLRHAGEPVAVELTAGRSRRSMAASSSRGRVESWPLESVPASSGDVIAGSESVVPFVGEAPLTYGVRAPTPFTSPPGAARHLALPGGRPRVAAGLATALLVLAVAGAALAVWWPFGPHEVARHAAAAPPISARASVSNPSSSSTSAERASVSTSPDRRSPAPRVGTVLAALDRSRSTAFAHRDPGLLTRVYASPSLLAQDRAMLFATVPVGCRLEGLRTSFRDVRVLGHRGDSTTVWTRAALSSARLRCAGAVAGSTPGTPRVLLRVELMRVNGSYRIASSRTVSPSGAHAGR